MSLIRTVSYVLLFAALLWATYVDLRQRIIPNACIGLIICAFCCNLATDAILVSSLVLACVRALAGVVFIGIIMGFCCKLIGSQNAHGSCGIGGGDIKLFLSLALWTGPLNAMLLLAGSCGGLVVVYALLCVVKKEKPRKDATLPMAPFASTVVCIMFAFGTLNGGL